MTLQNGLIHDRKAYLWSDTAFWNDTGQRIGTAPKVFTGTLWPWAATFSGFSPSDQPCRLVELMAPPLARTPARRIDAARECLAAEQKSGRDCRRLLAWPCPEAGARMYHIAAEKFPGRSAPLQPVRLSSYMCWGAEADWCAPYRGRYL